MWLKHRSSPTAAAFSGVTCTELVETTVPHCSHWLFGWANTWPYTVIYIAQCVKSFVHIFCAYLRILFISIVRMYQISTLHVFSFTMERLKCCYQYLFPHQVWTTSSYPTGCSSHPHLPSETPSRQILRDCFRHPPPYRCFPCAS